MATTVGPSQTREPSITRLECDVNPNFTFPALPHARSQSLRPGTLPSFPVFPPRRGSVPLNDVAGLASATLTAARPKSSSSNSLLSNGSKSAGAVSFEAGGLPSPVSPGQPDVGSTRGLVKPHYAGGIKPGARVLGVGITPTVLNASLSTNVKVGPVPEGKAHHRGLGDLLGGPITLEPKKEDIVSCIAEKVAPKRAPPPPGATRRGHAHRRSGAISSGDVWSLLSQSAPNLALACTGESGDHGTTSEKTEASPPKPIASAGSSPVLSWSAPVSPGFNGSSSLPSPTSPLMDYESAADKKNRVHFIDRVEIIPRPMSAGTETSSLATVRGHAGTDSISSIASVLPLPVPSPTIEAAPPPRHGRTRSNSQTMTQPTSALRATSDRPSTAGAILLTPPNIVIDSKAGEVIVPSLKRPATASPSLSSAPGSANNSPTKRSPSKKMHKKALSDYSPLVATGSFSDNRDISSIGASDEVPAPFEEMPSGSTCEKQKKKKKSKKQIKNWAGTILGKGRGLRHSKRQLRALPRRSPTPPLPRSEHQLGDNEWISAAWNESYVLMPVDDSLGANSSSENIAMDTGVESPIIDLDAALGPFKTPTGPSAGFAAARRRRMHSAVGLKGNGYFHRRSESMPEMQLFSLSEHEGDGHMADVFEEDEEEDSEESSESEDDDEEGKMNGGEGLGIGIKVVDGDGANWQEDVVMEWGSDDLGRPTSRRGSGGDRDLEWKSESSLLSANTSLDPESSTTSIDSINCPQDIEVGPSSPLPFSGRKGAPADIITPQSSSSTVTLPAHFQPPTYPQPLDSPSTFVTAASNPNTPLQLDFPGDEYPDSASSFGPYSDFLGEPGPEMRMSVDDIPSLTSSSSTMTIGGLYANMPSTPMNEPKEKEPSHKKEKSKRWSKVWTFWRLK
ncbi:hypothetical protein HOY80DRAFT_1055915 [Tuber brumale]|nr:hypothetical protein HOY80DRAFT_1055915 [Tuber brumale]